MKINWKKVLTNKVVQAVLKALYPFVVGALGGVATGCVSEHDIVTHLFA